MIEEEKKAINQLKADSNFYDYELKNGNYIYELFKIEVYKKDVDVTLNFIEKLQKENEYLKKNQRYKKDFNGDKTFSLEYDKETLRDMVLEKQEEIKELKSNSIPKDKIREKIKEKEAEKEGVKNISLEEYAITSKELKESEICLLKSLLEED